MVGRRRRNNLLLPLLLPLLISLSSSAAAALPLSTSSRWIVDESGQRVKLACANWVSHLDAVVAEGLSKQPLGAISARIASLGFNCVRLTWPLFLATNGSLASLTVRQSFQRLGLADAISGIQANNPDIIDLSRIEAYQVNAPLCCSPPRPPHSIHQMDTKGSGGNKKTQKHLRFLSCRSMRSATETRNVAENQRSKNEEAEIWVLTNDCIFFVSFTGS